MSLILALILSVIVFAITFGISFAPTILAFLRGNTYKIQTLVCQIIMLAVSLIISGFSNIFSLVSNLINGVGYSEISVITTIITVILALVELAAWVYIAINAWNDNEIDILSRFNIGTDTSTGTGTDTDI